MVQQNQGESARASVTRGSLLFIAKCSKPARLFINSLLADLRDAPDSGYIQLSQATISDVRWFQEMWHLYNGVSLLYHPPLDPDHQVDLDACLTGIGARSRQEFYTEQLPGFITQLNLSITHLEMFNILIATRLFAPKWSHHTVNLGCDNQAAVAVLQSAKAKDRFLAACAKQIWQFATVHDFSLAPFHRAGTEMQALGINALSHCHLAPKFQAIVHQMARAGRRLRVPLELFALPPL